MQCRPVEASVWQTLLLLCCRQLSYHLLGKIQSSLWVCWQYSRVLAAAHFILGDSVSSCLWALFLWRCWGWLLLIGSHYCSGVLLHLHVFFFFSFHQLWGLCVTLVLLDEEKYWFAVVFSKLLFHSVSGCLNHVICCYDCVWVACSWVAGMWLVQGGGGGGGGGGGVVINTLPLGSRCVCRQERERVAVEIFHYGPSVPSGWMGWRWSTFVGG